MRDYEIQEFGIQESAVTKSEIRDQESVGTECEVRESVKSCEPQYSISEVSDMTGISAYTLRYYDKCGFFPNLYRDKNKVRSFSDADISWLRLVDALRKSGLSIEGIQYFVKLSLRGDSSQDEQYRILSNQQTVLEYQIAEIEESLKVLQEETLRRKPR